MEFVIIFFSGTGNTELISNEIQKRLKYNGHSVELLSIEDKEAIKNVNFENKIMGFGFPVYKFTFPDIFLDIFQLINSKAINNKYFLFSTYARFISESFYDFSKNLNKKKFHLIAEQSFKCPSCGISARKHEKDFEYESVMFFEDNINFKLDSFIRKILTNVKMKRIKINHKHNFLNKYRLRIVKDIERTRYPKLQINNDRCTVCGLCAEKCPDNNLLKMGNCIKINNDTECLHCLRCINHCPSNAITFGKLTIGENRYTLKIRDKLFKEASLGKEVKYWSDFEAIIKEWRKNTIQYWKTYKNNPEIN